MALNVEFLNAGRSSYSSRGATAKPADTGLFWWTIIITLLLGAAIASWFFSIYVFNYPEVPFNYKLLNRLHKIEPLKKFERNDVPNGVVYGAKAAFQKFDVLTDKQLEEKSSLLRRSYLTNYRAIEDKPIYIKGDYKIYQVRPLTAVDVFPSGIVVRAQAIEPVEGAPMEFPNTIVEFVFPTNGPALAAFNVGDVLTIDQRSIYAKDGDKKTDARKFFASVINMERLPQHKLLLTLVPLLYGNCEINGDPDSKLTMDPPAKLNLEGKWPITEEATGSMGTPPTSVANAVPGEQ
jgi:hypothetical protein